MDNLDDKNTIDTEWFQGLKHYLHSETIIEKDDKRNQNEISIKVRNIAPVNYDGSNIVFIGVGLRIIDGRRKVIDNLQKIRKKYKIEIIEGEKSKELRQLYRTGIWIMGAEFPDITANEQSFGKVLFPEESITYKMQVTTDTLPYLDMRVEGQLSRRYLFRFSYPVSEIASLTKPLVTEVFQKLNKINIRKELICLLDESPDFQPQTTIADLDTYRKLVQKAASNLKNLMDELNGLYYSAPNQVLRDYMKQYVGRYLTSSIQICKNAEEALSSRDVDHMQGIDKALKSKIQEWEEIEEKQEELRSRFEIEY